MEEKKVSENGKMTFRGYYESLPGREHIAPKKEFVMKISEICMSAESTVRAWLGGVQQPDALRKKVIAEYLGIDADKLFPR